MFWYKILSIVFGILNLRILSQSNTRYVCPLVWYKFYGVGSLGILKLSPTEISCSN